MGASKKRILAKDELKQVKSVVFENCFENYFTRFFQYLVTNEVSKLFEQHLNNNLE